MRPTYVVGDAVLVKVTGATGIAPGDVVVFRRKKSTMVLHRVIDTRRVLGRPYFMTKGDANAASDPDLTPAGTVFGRAGHRIPHLGQWLSQLSTRPIKLALLGIVGLTVIQESIVAIRIHRRRRRRRSAMVGIPCEHQRGQPSS
jgi:signal peptidase